MPISPPVADAWRTRIFRRTLGEPGSGDDLFDFETLFGGMN